MMKKTLVSSAILMGLLTTIPVQADFFSDTGGWIDDNIIDPIEDGAEDVIDWADGTIKVLDKQGFPMAAAMAANIVEAGFTDYNYALNTNDWRIKALRLQNKLDHDLPIGEALFIGTHNSFNATEYSDGTSYLDPNHKMSLYDQLDAGMVALELDVHRDTNANNAWVWEWESELMLCHRKHHNDIKDGICSVADRTLLEGLTEIKFWLEKNTQDVIFIYIEDFMGKDDYQYAIKYLEQTIGDKVYRPPYGQGCVGMPMDVSKKDILASGKQVLLFGASQTCSNTTRDWESWTYGGTAWDGDQAEKVRAGQGGSAREGRWLRYFEDRTDASSNLGDRTASENIHGSDMPLLMKQGANFIGLDMLGYASTDRITGAIWSWNGGEPNNYNGAEHCAESHTNGRVNDYTCGSFKPFSCKNSQNEWYVTTGTGSWSEGKDMCSAETGGEYRFSMPMTYNQNQALIQAKKHAGASRTWLAYTDQYSEGNWKIKQQAKNPFEDWLNSFNQIKPF